MTRLQAERGQTLMMRLQITSGRVTQAEIAFYKKIKMSPDVNETMLKRKNKFCSQAEQPIKVKTRA
jgi:hypothetical protein